MSNVLSRSTFQAGSAGVPSVIPAVAANPSPDTEVRARRSAEASTSSRQESSWTLEPLSPPSAEASSAADSALVSSLGASSIHPGTRTRIVIDPATTIFPLFEAYRAAFNTPELLAWFQKHGIAMSTVVVKPDSVSGVVNRDGVTSLQTFNTHDGSGWWQVSARLRSAVEALDPEGKGLPYVQQNADAFDYNAVLRWHASQAPASEGNAAPVAGVAALSPQRKAVLEAQINTVRNSIDALDQRASLAKTLTALIAGQDDDKTVSLAGLDVEVSSRSTLARNDSGKVFIGDVLHDWGVPLPKTVGELRNTVRWLTTALPPPVPNGNYTSHLLSKKWAPGSLSITDKLYLIQLNNHDVPSKSSAYNLLAMLNNENILDRYSDKVLRADADRFLGQLLSDSSSLYWGEVFAQEQGYHGASGTKDMSDHERGQWLLAAIKLQIDPDSPGRAGSLAGYDIYQPANSGRTVGEVRADIETHLKQNKLLDPRAAPLIAHLFLASVAPEFLVQGVSQIRMGSAQWTDLRLGVAIAEHLGGPGTSRVMSDSQIMGLSRLHPRTPDEAALFENYGMDALLDWGLMRGVYSLPADGRYTPQMYQKTVKAFEAEREQMTKAAKTFNAPLPTRENIAIAHLHKMFPERSVEQIKALRVHIADPDVSRNMLLSEPRTRSLLETYMTGDLIKGRWMLLEPGQPLPVPVEHKTPFDIHRFFSTTQQQEIDANVKGLDARITAPLTLDENLADAVDTYLGNLKQGLGTVTKRMIADLPLADRQSLEFGNVELFALRLQADVPTLEQTAQDVEERRGRRGTLIRSEYKGVIRYFEVFPDKMLMVKREDLAAQLNLGGVMQTHPKTYGPWAPTNTQLQNGLAEPFDFNAYTSDALPRPDAKSTGVIIEKLGDTLVPDAEAAGRAADDVVPDSFSSSRTQAIVDRIMQGNFVHHRDTVLDNARGKLPLEQQRELLQNNKRILLGMIPFIGAIKDLAEGNIVDGTRGLIIDLTGALLGGAGQSLKSFVKSTKVVAPFGTKAFSVLQSGVSVVSAFLNPLDGSADLLAGAAKHLIALPKVVSKAPKTSLLTNLGSVEEKLRAFLGVGVGNNRLLATQSSNEQAAANGHNHSVPVQAIAVGQNWYAAHPETGLPMGTPLDGFEPLSGTTAPENPDGAVASSR